MTSVLSNLSFKLTGILSTSSTSVTVSNDIERNQVIVATNASVVLQNSTGTELERMVCTFAGGTMTIVYRGLDQSATITEVPALKKEWRTGTTGYITMLAPDIFDLNAASATLPGDYTFTGDSTHSGDETFTGTLTEPVYASEAARDAAITSPTNGMVVYCTAEGKYYDYTAGSWIPRESGGTFPNASETVAGKVEIATTTEFNNGTDTGDTGAGLIAKPSDIVNKIDTDIAAIDKSVTISEFIAGEDITENDALFLENGTTLAAATTEASIGYDASTTRFSLPIFGTGVGFNSLNLNLRKFSSPSANLNFRIETDNNGSPSGTLIDASSIGTIAPGDLTTSLADTEILLSGVTTDNEHGVTLDSNETSQTLYKGIKFTLTNQSGMLTVDKVAACTATKAYLYDSNFSLLATASFSSNTATFNYNDLTVLQSYYLLVGSDGSSYTSVKQTGAASYPYIDDKLTYIGGLSQVNNVNSPTVSSSIPIGATGTLRVQFTPKVDCYLVSVSNSIYNGGNNTLYNSGLVLLETATGQTFSGNTKLIARNTYYLFTSHTNDTTYNLVNGDTTDITFVDSRMSSGAGASVWPSAISITTNVKTDNTTEINNITKIVTNDNIVIPEGNKAHIVAFAGTYGSETVNTTNYYGIGYSTNHTTTRGIKLRDGSAWGATATTVFPYVSSTGIQDQLLSKTDSDYIYKTDFLGFAYETKAAGQTTKVATSGIKDGFTSLTTNAQYYLNATPGSIGTTAGTNQAIIAEAKNANDLLLLSLSSKRIALSGYTVNSSSTTENLSPSLLLKYNSVIQYSFDLYHNGSSGQSSEFNIQISLDNSSRTSYISEYAIYATVVRNSGVRTTYIPKGYYIRARAVVNAGSGTAGGDMLGIIYV